MKRSIEVLIVVPLALFNILLNDPLLFVILTLPFVAVFAAGFLVALAATVAQ